VSAYLELSFDLGSIDAQAAEAAALALGACALTFVDARDDPVLEPAVGEVRLWPATRLKCLFESTGNSGALSAALGALLDLDAARIEARVLPERTWEREWLRDFHAMRFGRRLWICPHHESVSAPGAIVVALDPGLAFGTGTHASTALCLLWLDAHLTPGARVIDYGSGSGVLALAAAKLGASEVHCFDIDPQARIATHANAAANALLDRIHVHERADTLPRESDVVLANILSETLIPLAATFAAQLRPGGQAVLGGLLENEVTQVTAAYAACFDVVKFGNRDGWVCLEGRRR